MAYVFELDSALPTAPFVDMWDTEIVEFALGYDVEADKVIIMSVMLVPGGSYLDGELEGVFDLRFGIRERDGKHAWNVSPPDYTVKCTKKYIPKKHRKAVMDLLCRAVALLANHSNAKHLTMETFSANLPDKALNKYKKICNSLNECGFELKDEFCNSKNGKNYWFLSSVPIEPEA
jgi:hypothetical protein